MFMLIMLNFFRYGYNWWACVWGSDQDLETKYKIDGS